MNENAMVTVTSKGQMVIPARFRRELGIRKGTRVSVTQHDGHLILQPITKEFIRSLQGCLKGGPPLLQMLLEERRKEAQFENLRAGRERFVSRPRRRRAIH
ncbi:MAG TPA: AbrB/MazE/SpoVT family DNA-binding domain-containing protein [Terriglobia bacterium]|nr:AbrB/MazE/SpoVT family DNA-binding domain-containing protein [Terriglobia bacterium]